MAKVTFYIPDELKASLDEYFGWGEKTSVYAAITSQMIALAKQHGDVAVTFLRKGNFVIKRKTDES